MEDETIAVYVCVFVVDVFRVSLHIMKYCLLPRSRRVERDLADWEEKRAKDNNRLCEIVMEMMLFSEENQGMKYETGRIR